MYIRIYMVVLWMNIEYGPLSQPPRKFEITGLCLPVTSNIHAPIYSNLRTFIFDITGYSHHTISNIAIRSPNSIS